MRLKHFVCWLALSAGSVVFGIHGAAAQASPEVRQACTPDAMRLCSEFIPNAEKVKTCMMAKRSQLSEACRVAIRGGGRVRRHEVRHRRYRVHCRRGRRCR